MFHHRAQEVDTHMVDGLRNFLFGTENLGIDLAATNIQRGRDHGLADYNSVRVALGLARKTTFLSICPHKPELAKKLKDLYLDIDNIDLWVGGLAEEHVRDGALGETFASIVREQFERVRDGDRFFYEATFGKEDVARFKKQGLCKVLKDVSFTENDECAKPFRVYENTIFGKGKGADGDGDGDGGGKTAVIVSLGALLFVSCLFHLNVILGKKDTVQDADVVKAESVTSI
jgi:hypothetical protein